MTPAAYRIVDKRGVPIAAAVAAPAVQPVKAAGQRNRASVLSRVMPAGFERDTVATQDSLLPWLPRGLNDPLRRGEDVYEESNRASFTRYLETLRERDPLLFRGCNYFDNFAVSKGFTYSSDVPMVQKLTKRLWNDNDMDDMQHRLAVELFGSGMLVIRIPKMPAGDKRVPSVELIPSSQITHIATKDGRVAYFRRRWHDLEYPEPRQGPQLGVAAITPKRRVMTEDVPAGEVVHITINSGAKDLRGVSPLGVALKWSTLFSRDLEAIHMLSLARSYLGYVMTVPGTDVSDEEMKTLRNYIQQQLVQRTDMNGMSYHTIPTGQVLVVPEGVKMEGVNLLGSYTGGSNNNEVREHKLMAAVAMGLPEFMLSDGNYSNLASSVSQNNPLFRLIDAFQRSLLRAIREIVRLSFDRYMDMGYFAQMPEQMVKRDVDHVSELVDITAPDIITPDITALATPLATLVDRNMVSRETTAGMLGLDWKKERQRILDEKAMGLPLMPSAPGQPAPGTTAQPPTLFSAGAQPVVRTPDGVALNERAAQLIREARVLYTEKAKASGGDPDALLAAASEFRQAVRDVMQQLLAKAREIGQQSDPNTSEAA